MRDLSTDVLIVGAGPTGLMLGIELARREVPCRVVERLPEPLEWDRATVVHSRTLEIFEATGTAEAFLNCGHPITSVGFFDQGERVGALQLGGIDSRFPFDLNIPEQRTERILTAQLERHGVRVEHGIEFERLEQTDDGVRVGLSSADELKFELTARFVVGCDGYNSAVRKAVGSGFGGHDYPSLWGVVDGRISGWSHPADETAVQLEAPGVNPIPLPNGRWRVYFRAEPREPDALGPLREGLDVLSPGAVLHDPGEPQFFRTHFRVAERYRTGRVLLAGDAAHVCSPIQGHGMNAGIQDAYNLGWKLALVLSGASSDALLDSYDAERRPVAEAIGRSGEAAESRWVDQDSAVMLKIMDRLATATGGRAAAVGLSEIGFTYEESPIISEAMAPERSGGSVRGQCLDGVCLGARVGDADELEGRDGRLRLHELIDASGFTLLVLLDNSDAIAAGEELAHARHVTRRHDPHLRAYLVTRLAIQLPDAPSEHLWDAGGALHERFGADEPALCLLRPDGHLGFRAAPPDWEALEEHLGHIVRSV